MKADVGRNLTLASEQDSDRYDAKQQSASAGGSFTFGSMTGSGSVNVSQDKLHSNFDSVQEQTGIFAGKGGFDVKVGEHTQLDGAVIGSTATADKNMLDTGTLGFTDIHNQADFKTEHQSAGFSSGGAIVIRDQEKQTQNVSDLSRDVEHANQTLQAMLGHRSVESTQIYTQVSIRALHARTHPAELREEDKPDRPENSGHNDTTIDTTKGAGNEHNPLQNRR